MGPYFGSIKLPFYSIVWWCSGTLDMNLPSTSSCRCYNFSSYETPTGLHPFYDVIDRWTIAHAHLSYGWFCFCCDFNNDKLQLPWWGILLACVPAFIFTLPVGVIAATTNQITEMNVITEYIIGFLYPGYLVANICFKVYGYTSMKQALVFLQDLKLGHYIKIPPRTMFMAQVIDTLISSLVHLGTTWGMIDTIHYICDREAFPPSSPWTCPGFHVLYKASEVWGLIGPQLIFGNLGYYSAINSAFLGGDNAPIVFWLAIKAFPNQQWLRNVSVSVILVFVIRMPPATTVNYTIWNIIGFLSGYVAFPLFGVCAFEGNIESVGMLLEWIFAINTNSIFLIVWLWSIRMHSFLLEGSILFCSHWNIELLGSWTSATSNADIILSFSSILLAIFKLVRVRTKCYLLNCHADIMDKDRAPALDPLSDLIVQHATLKDVYLQVTHLGYGLQSNHHLEDKVVLKAWGNDTPTGLGKNIQQRANNVKAPAQSNTPIHYEFPTNTGPTPMKHRLT